MEILMPDRKIAMPYGEEFAFHCQRCGATVDESGKCHYCGSKNKIRYNPTSDLQFYIEIDDDKKFYFNHITDVGDVNIDAPQLEITTISDVHTKYISGYGSSNFDFSFYATDDALLKSEILQEAKLFTLNIAIKGMSKVVRVRAENFSLGIPEVSQLEPMKFHPSMEIHDYDGWVDPTMTAPESTRCPNCGAIVRKTYGLCDYCGGWVEYV